MSDYDPEKRRHHWAKTREDERKKILAVRIRFTCARCGGKFHVPDSFETNDDDGAREFVRLGGNTVCTACAPRRHRRMDGISVDAIAPGMRFAK